MFCYIHRYEVLGVAKDATVKCDIASLCLGRIQVSQTSAAVRGQGGEIRKAYRKLAQVWTETTKKRKVVSLHKNASHTTAALPLNLTTTAAQPLNIPNLKAEFGCL